jgi:hypothetical protein
MTTNKLCAYDYERQVWVEGDAALPLLRDQLADDIRLLETDPRYATFTRCADVPAQLAQLRAQLAALS